MLKRLVETSLNWFFHGLSEMINGQDLQPVHPKTGSTLTNGLVFFGLFLLGSVQFRSFFRSSELDLKTLGWVHGRCMAGGTMGAHSSLLNMFDKHALKYKYVRW